MQVLLIYILNIKKIITNNNLYVIKIVKWNNKLQKYKQYSTWKLYIITYNQN